MAIWPFSMKSGQDTAQRARLALPSLWTPSRDAPLKVITGLINDGGGVVTVVPGTMDVSCTPFRGMVQGAVSGTQGGYAVVNDANITTTLPNGGGGAVQYTIAAIVEDSAFDLSGQQRVRLTSYPTAGGPPVNSGVIPLRQINLRAGVSVGTGGLLSGDLNTDFRVYTVAVGGILPRTSSTRPGTPAEGSWIWESDTKMLRVWDGAAWFAIRKNVLITINQFLSTANWNKPADVKVVRSRAWGGGGAGGPVDGFTGQGEGGGGGGGSYCEKVWDAAALAGTISFVVGAGGVGSLVSTAPSGTASSFNGSSAGGGGGGTIMQSNTTSQLADMGVGGTATGGDVNVRGGDGGRGRTITGQASFHNFGGAAAKGGGIKMNPSSVAGPGAAGNFPGGGGTGAFTATTDQSGGSGAAGLGIVENVF